MNATFGAGGVGGDGNGGGCDGVDARRRGVCSDGRVGACSETCAIIGSRACRRVCKSENTAIKQLARAWPRSHQTFRRLSHASAVSMAKIFNAKMAKNKKYFVFATSKKSAASKKRLPCRLLADRKLATCNRRVRFVACARVRSPVG